MCFFFRQRFKQGGEHGEAGGELFYSRLDKLGLKLDVRVSLAEFIMTKINKFSLEGPSNCDTIEHDFLLENWFDRLRATSNYGTVGVYCLKS